MGAILSAAIAVLLLQVKPPIQYELKIGDAYTYEMTYGEKGGSDGSVTCKLRVECRAKKDEKAPARKPADYLLRFTLSDFKCSFPQERDSERMKEVLATIKRFSFTAEMDRSGELHTTDLQQAIQDFTRDASRKKHQALEPIKSMVGTIWFGLFPWFDTSFPEDQSNRVCIRDRDWGSLGVTSLNMPMQSAVYSLSPEYAETNRRFTGRMILWRRITEVQSAKDLGGDDISMSLKTKMIFREGVCEEFEIENQQTFDNGKTSPTAFSRCKLVEQQEMDK